MEATAHQWADQDPNRSSSKQLGQDQERKVRPKNEQALNCPRCHSTNTKFCYYNNYSLTQPRYFCKACKRYWTAGGSLRNIPVGGASRKNKRSSSTTIPTSSKLPTLSHFSSQNPNPNNVHKGQDLNLAFQPPHQDQSFHHGFSQFLKMNSSNSNNSSSLSDLLRNGISSNPTLPIMPAGGASAMYNNPLGFTFQEFNNPTAGFVIDGNGMKYGGFNENNQGISGGRMMLPFEALTREGGDPQNMGGKENSSNGYWKGMLGGGSC